MVIATGPISEDGLLIGILLRVDNWKRAYPAPKGLVELIIYIGSSTFKQLQRCPKVKEYQEGTYPDKLTLFGYRVMIVHEPDWLQIGYSIGGC